MTNDVRMGTGGGCTHLDNIWWVSDKFIWIEADRGKSD